MSNAKMSATWENVHVYLNTSDDIYHPGAVQHTLSVTIDSLEELKNVPALAFGVKVSQSRKPEKAGKVVFKNFYYRLSPTESYQSFVPVGVTVATPLEQIKTNTIEQLTQVIQSRQINMENVSLGFSFKMHGDWADIETPDGNYALFDLDRYPDNDGNPDYYLKHDVPITIVIHEGESHGNSFLYLDLKTKQMASEIFAMRGRNALRYFDGGQGSQKSTDTLSIPDGTSQATENNADGANGDPNKIFGNYFG